MLPAHAPDTLLIAVDQVAYYDGEIREKPKNDTILREWIKQYSIKPVHVCTAIVIQHSRTGQFVEVRLHA